MTTMELSVRKLEFVKEFLDEEDENLVKELMSFFTKAKYATIPGVPSTVEELKASVARAEKECEKGLTISHEEVFEKYVQWL